jgi:hypothetical protein
MYIACLIPDGVDNAVLNVNNNPGAEHTVAENSPVTLTCSGQGGRPDTNRTSVRDNTGQQVATGASSVLYDIASAQCQHTGSYTCAAGNGMGPDKEATTTLYVNCEYVIYLYQAFCKRHILLLSSIL